MIVSKYSFRIGKTHKNSCWRIAIHDAILFLVCIITLRFPFDWKNPLGYLVAFILICIINLNIVIFMMCNLCLGIEVYALITSFTKDIKYELSAFSRMARSELNLSKRLFGIVHFHSTVKRFDKSNFDYIPRTQFSFDFFWFSFSFLSKTRLQCGENRWTHSNGFLYWQHFSYVHSNDIHTMGNGKNEYRIDVIVCDLWP